MATSPEAFNQVRDILKKLDRSIDSARDKRLLSEEPGDAVGDGPGNSLASQNGQNRHSQSTESSDQADHKPAADHPDTPGKARPLRARPMTPRPVDPSDRWSPSGR